MLVKKVLTEVVGLQNPVDKLFVLELRSTEKPFRFLPGQFLHLALDPYDPTSGWPESRCFSIQSQKGPDHIVLSFSVKGQFTTRMASEITTGKNIWVKLPYGSLFQDLNAAAQCVFIAGGTGITPFLSLFSDRSFESYKTPELYAGFRNKRFNVYDDYLVRAKTINQAFEYEIRYEDRDGMLDISKIFNKQGKEAVYFLSGPPQMIKQFRAFLEKSGTDPGNIRTDDWE